MKTEKLLTLAAAVGGLFLFMNLQSKKTAAKLASMQTQYGAGWADNSAKPAGTQKTVSDILESVTGLA